MSSLNYDSSKLPLGKLSENTLRKGYSVLRQISALLEGVKLSQIEHSEDQSAALSALTSRYYGVIPRADSK